MPPKKKPPLPKKKEEKLFRVENPLDTLSKKLHIANYLFHRGTTETGGKGKVPSGTPGLGAGVQWDEIDFPNDEVRDAFGHILLGVLQEKKKSGKSDKAVAPGDPRFTSALVAQALEWDQQEVATTNEKVEKLFTDQVPLGKIRGHKQNYEDIQDLQQLVSRKIIGGAMGVFAMAAAVWYQSSGGVPGTIVLEVENWANCVSADPAAQQKCVMWLQWVPETSYAAFPDEFGSANYHRMIRAATHPNSTTTTTDANKKTAPTASGDAAPSAVPEVAAFNLVARDGTGSRWNAVAIPYLPQLLDDPKLKSFAAQLAVPGKCTLAVHTMRTETAILLGQAEVGTSPKPGCNENNVSYVPLPQPDLAEMNVKKIKKELRDRNVTDNSDCVTSEDLRKKLARLRAAESGGESPEEGVQQNQAANHSAEVD